MIAELGENLQTSLRNYAISFRSAHASRLTELLADPAFRPLKRQVNLTELQATHDQLLDQVRQSTL